MRVVPTETRTQTAKKDFEDSGADEVLAGIRRDRNVDRCTRRKVSNTLTVRMGQTDGL